jgi:tRNA (guanine37-N1)-methyltransferase
MRIDLVTTLPDAFTSVLGTGIFRIAAQKGVCEFVVHNLHDYSDDKFGHVDDKVYGGGAGMLIMCEPVFRLVEELKNERDYDEVIYVTADGKKHNQQIANEISLKNNLIFICGRYKGIDQRIRDLLVTRELSIGDYVLTGGELAAMVVIDSVIRLIPGSLGDAESALEDSFQDGLLEAPNYTRPEVFRGLKVPDVLVSGNHKKISDWRREQSFEKTKRLRPDLLEDD